jgi:hypothetical protein
MKFSVDLPGYKGFCGPINPKSKTNQPPVKFREQRTIRRFIPSLQDNADLPAATTLWSMRVQSNVAIRVHQGACQWCCTNFLYPFSSFSLMIRVRMTEG